MDDTVLYAADFPMAGGIKRETYRIIDVIIVSTLYLIFGLLGSYTINKFSFPLNPKQNKIWIFLQVVAEVAATIVFAYLIHNAIARLPLPMLGDEKLKRQVISQVRGGIVIAFAMFALQTKLLKKIQFIFN